MYLLDTCVIIDFVRGDTNTLKVIKSMSPDFVALSTVSAFELRYGLEKASHGKNKSAHIVESFLSEAILLNFRLKEATEAAKIRNNLRALGKPIGPYDVLIAATAIANDLTLVTSNEREFSRIENLMIENWRR